MEKKTVGIIATVATVLLCGCPGLVSFCMGAISLLAGFIPGSEIDIFGSSEPQSAMIYGIASICGGLIFIVIPIVVGIVTLRKPKAEATGSFGEPLPPAG
jgi:hypothetical protein